MDGNKTSVNGDWMNNHWYFLYFLTIIKAIRQKKHYMNYLIHTTSVEWTLQYRNEKNPKHLYRSKRYNFGI